MNALCFDGKRVANWLGGVEDIAEIVGRRCLVSFGVVDCLNYRHSDYFAYIGLGFIFVETLLEP